MENLKIQWHTEVMHVANLKEWVKNPRKITESEYFKLIDSIKNFGFHDVLKIDLDGTIISGHQRKRALMEIGVEEVNVMVPDRPLTEKEKEIIAVASNMHRGVFDDDMLANQFDIDNLMEAGFSKNDLSMFELQEDGLDEVEEVKKIVDPKVLQGEVYILGEHRLMCGDSTVLVHVDKLMDGSKARMIFTDPPYGIGYVAGISKGEENKTEKHDKILNDDLKGDKLSAFLKSAFENAYISTTEDATYYCWFSYTTNNQFREALRSSGWKNSQLIVWAKSHFSISSQDYQHCFELCLYGWKEHKAHFSNRTIRSFKDVHSIDHDDFADHLNMWFIKRDTTSDYHHPTQKPVKLAERALKMSTHVDDVVLDLFGGSGFVLIACEQARRKARIMELDNKYVHLMLNRWEAFTGKDAIRESDNKTWKEIKTQI